MKRKFLSKTYLRDAEKYDIKFHFDDKFCICVKRYIKVKPFVSRHGYKLIDNNYQMVEIMPWNEHYMMRIYLNDKLEVQERYFDVTKQNAIDKDTGMPYYDDLYLDVVQEKHELLVHDEKELASALTIGDITKADYNLAIVTKDKLLQEIKDGTNKLLNMNLTQYLF